MQPIKNEAPRAKARGLSNEILERPNLWPRKYKTKSGFTLIEMLIVAAMVSIVSLAMYATLNNGLEIWQKVNNQIPESELGLLFDRLTFDLKNTLRFEGIKFNGERNKFSFATLINFPFVKRMTVGEASYIYEEGQGILSRAQKDFSQVYSKEDNPASDTLSNIKSLKFSYYFYDEQTKEYLWLEDWSKKGLPLAVRLELEFDNGKDTSKFTKTVSIPASG
ncbi:MAG: prepilin-type N-terminal cleavage/methylation domain-containing protein [Candidatus Omnitrophota bacterium]